jgi:Short C-terminal domain
VNDQPVMEFTSHVAGRNANVAIYPDRMEWARTGLGVTLGLPLRRDTNMIPVRQIQGVSTHKAGLAYTSVRVATGGDATEFRVSKRQAEEAKATLLRLMMQSAPGAGQPGHGPGPSIADELRKLGELRDAGLLSEAEFAERKARLLGS